ncbi:hypothetical protein CIB84_014381, partial [Bambusicola thoracicus]
RQNRCPVPHIENGRRAPSHYIFRPGDAARFTCNVGYTLQGSHLSVCQADFSWSPPLPACKKGKCAVCHSLSSSQTIILTISPMNRIMTLSSISSPPAGVMCPQPPNIANGLHSGQSMDKVLPGAVVYYSCKEGFELVGNVSISCSEVGRWSRPLPRCQGGWRQP